MRSPFWNLRALTDPSWWHWAATVPMLAAHLAGVAGAIYLAIAVCAVMAAWYLLKLRQVRPFPVQVRLAYLGLLIAGFLPAMHWIYWVQLVGTSAMVLAGYCPLARMLALAPWNREERFSWALLKAAVVAPRAGGLVDGRRQMPQMAFASNGIPASDATAATSGGIASCSLACSCSPRGK